MSDNPILGRRLAPDEACLEIMEQMKITPLWPTLATSNIKQVGPALSGDTNARISGCHAHAAA
jgi:hypothetical protein